MSEPSAIDLVFYLLVLILPLSALFAQRLPLSSMLKMVVGWVAIFALLAILVGQRERFRPLWDGAIGAVGGNEQIVTGSVVRIPMASDGHFWATARINGATVRLLIDSGATTTALNESDARAAGIKPDGLSVGIDTANGRIIATSGTADVLQLEAITARDLPIVVSPVLGETSLLGMNFLSRLRSWRVEGRTLILEPVVD